MIQFIFIEIVALLLLNGGAIFIEASWPVHFIQEAFFSKEISSLDNIPYWLASNLLLIVANGIALIHDGNISFNAGADGKIAGRIPFISHLVLGYNLIIIPILILLPRFLNLI